MRFLLSFLGSFGDHDKREEDEEEEDLHGYVERYRDALNKLEQLVLPIDPQLKSNQEVHSLKSKKIHSLKSKLEQMLNAIGTRPLGHAMRHCWHSVRPFLFFCPRREMLGARETMGRPGRP